MLSDLATLMSLNLSVISDPWSVIGDQLVSWVIIIFEDRQSLKIVMKAESSQQIMFCWLIIHI